MLEVCRLNNKMCVINMGVHIGSAIKKRAEELGIKPTELGKKIGLVRAAVYKIYDKSHIRTDMLEKISLELNYNFFSLLSNDIESEANLVSEPLIEYDKAPEEEPEKVGFTFFVDVDNMEDFKEDFKEFIKQKKAN